MVQRASKRRTAVHPQHHIKRMGAMVRGLGNFVCITFQSLTLISDLIIGLIAKKMSLPARTASPAPSSAPRAISLSSSGSNWYASPCTSCAACRRVTVFVLGPPLVETTKILLCFKRPPAMRPFIPVLLLQLSLLPLCCRLLPPLLLLKVACNSNRCGEHSPVFNNALMIDSHFNFSAAMLRPCPALAASRGGVVLEAMSCARCRFAPRHPVMFVLLQHTVNSRCVD